jgi:Putative gypsy type transposon./Protein of unknown function (DUF390).
VLNRYIPCVLRKKWDDWKSDWFYTPLANEARLRLPSQPPAQVSSWRAPVDLGEDYDAVLDRLAGLRSQGLTGAMVYGDFLRRRIAPLQRRARSAWEYTGPEDYMRTHQGARWDWAPEDFKIVVQRVLNLSSVEASRIPQEILPLCSDPDRASILTIMMGVGASEERTPKDHDGAGESRRGEQSAPGGGRASGPRVGGPGSNRPADAQGKRKLGGTPPPSPPRGGGAVRTSSRRPEGAAPTSQPEGERKKKRLRKMGETEPARGNLISPPRWSFNRPPRRFVPLLLQPFFSHLKRKFFLTHFVRLLVFSSASAMSRRIPPATPSLASPRPKIQRPKRSGGENLTGVKPQIVFGKLKSPPGRPPELAKRRKLLGRRPPGLARLRKLLRRSRPGSPS